MKSYLRGRYRRLIIATLLPIFLTACSREDEDGITDGVISMTTPYVSSSDIAFIGRTFSSTANAPWGVAHPGIDFFPSGNLRPFQAVSSGVVDDIRLWQNPISSTYQVNVRIRYNFIYSVDYAFEPFSSAESDGQIQLSNILVSVGQSLSRGDIIGKLYTVGSAAHVHFTLMKNWVAICPEPYFTQEAKDSILNLIRKDHPDWNICY